MHLHGMNDNKLIPNLSYLSVYQDEAKKNRYLKRNKYIFSVGTTPPPKNWQKGGAYFYVNIENFKTYKSHWAIE